MKKCYVVGAGDFVGFIAPQGEKIFIIAADGGYDNLKSIGIKPDLIVGDLDSSTFIPNDTEIIKYSPKKDYTDTFLAVQKAVELGYDEIWLFGCLGGRIDHSTANFQMIAHYSEKGIKCRMFSDKYEVFAVTDGDVEFDRDEKGYISVFSFSDVSKGVCVSGLKYTLENAELRSDLPIGVSNEFIGENAKISVKSGTLIIIKERKYENG